MAAAGMPKIVATMGPVLNAGPGRAEVLACKCASPFCLRSSIQ
jgi:hypothetical protein